MNRNSINTGFTDLQEVFYKYAKHWKWFIFSIIFCTIIAFIYTKTLETVYNMSASTILREDETNPLTSSASKKRGGLDMLGGSGNTEDEALIMKSYSSMKNMAYDLGLYKSYKLNNLLSSRSLYNNSPVVLDVDKCIIDTLTTALLFDVEVDKANSIEVTFSVRNKEILKENYTSLPVNIKTSFGSFILRESGFKLNNSSYSITIRVIPLGVLAESLQKNIIVEPAHRKSDILSLNVKDVVPQRGMDMLNYVIKLYNDKTLLEKNGMARNSISFIEDRVKGLYNEVDSIETIIADFKKNNHMIDIGSTAGTFFSRYQSSLDRTISFDVQSGILEMLDNHVSDSKNEFALIPITSQVPDAALKIVSEYNAAILERERLLKNSSQDNPVVATIDSRIKSMREGVLLTIKNMRKDFDLQKQQWKSFDSDMVYNMAQIPQKEQEYLNIERQRQIKTSLYLYLLNKKEETQLLLASGASRAKIVNDAYTNSLPVGPPQKIIIAIGLLIGLLLPIIVIYIRLLLKIKISSKDEMQEYTNIPVLGEICLNKLSDRVVIKDSTNTPISELFRLVRTNLQFILKQDQKVILITSSISGEGKTFFSLNLGLSFSLIKNKKVVLVGLDIRNPKLGEYLSVKNNIGITTYLSSDETKPEDIIIQESHLHSNFYIIPSGPVPPNPSELLLNDRLDELFTYLRNNFDYIIVDTAPTAMVSDTFSLDRISDATLFLFRANYTNKSYLKLMDSYIEDDKLKNISIVINGTTTRASYGYGYGEK